MKRILFAAATMLALQSFGQVSPEILPHYMTEAEKAALERLDFAPVVTRGIETPPPFDGLRTMAEWEEIEALKALVPEEQSQTFQISLSSTQILIVFGHATILVIPSMAAKLMTEFLWIGYTIALHVPMTMLLRNISQSI
jgi:hypothetical protein